MNVGRRVDYAVRALSFLAGQPAGNAGILWHNAGKPAGHALWRNAGEPAGA